VVAVNAHPKICAYGSYAQILAIPPAKNGVRHAGGGGQGGQDAVSANVFRLDIFSTWTCRLPIPEKKSDFSQDKETVRKCIAADQGICIDILTKYPFHDARAAPPTWTKMSSLAKATQTVRKQTRRTHDR